MSMPHWGEGSELEPAKIFTVNFFLNDQFMMCFCVHGFFGLSVYAVLFPFGVQRMFCQQPRNIHSHPMEVHIFFQIWSHQLWNKKHSLRACNSYLLI